VEDNGKIIELTAEGAKVEIVPRPICGACAVANACAAIGLKTKIVLAKNPIAAQVGDLVKLETKEKNRTLSILLVFGLPIVFLLVGIIIGEIIAGDKLAAILGGGGLLLAFLIAKIIDTHLAKKGTFLPMIIEKISSPIPEPSCPESNRLE